MPTTVHIPKALLDAVDRRAKGLKISRNRFVVLALEKELARETQWSPGFFDTLMDIEPGDASAIDELTRDVRARRASKAPRRL